MFRVSLLITALVLIVLLGPKTHTLTQPNKISALYNAPQGK